MSLRAYTPPVATAVALRGAACVMIATSGEPINPEESQSRRREPLGGGGEFAWEGGGSGFWDD